MSGKKIILIGLLMILSVFITMSGCATQSGGGENGPQQVKISLVDGILGAVMVEWQPVANASAYIVQFGDGSRFDQSSGEIKDTSWIAEDLYIFQQDPYKPGSKDTYKFRVLSVDSNGKKSKPSKTLNIKVYVCPPANITVTPGNKGQLIVKWEHVDGASHVNIKWGTVNDVGLAAGNDHTFEAPYGQGQYTINGLKDGTQYYVWLQTAAVISQEDITEWYDGDWSKAIPGTTIKPE